MDENRFFREATIEICGHLDIETSLQASLVYLQRHLPADHIFLQLYEPGLGAMRTIATATASDAKQLDRLTPLPLAVRQRLQNAPAAGPTCVIEQPGKNPVAEEMLRFHRLEGSSVLRMSLTSTTGQHAGVVLTAEGPDRFTDEHAKLLALLREPFTIALSNTLEHREVLRLRDRLADDNRYLVREMLRRSGDEIVGADFGLKTVMQLTRQVAPTESPVLLFGETGVGKDVVANAIHLASARRDGPFIAVNCGAIPDALIDSELFGHEKGAFTGALAQKRGRFERAQHGTLFLDEVAEMPLAAQVRLLRVLQNREIERVGGTERIGVDVRIVAATHRDLEALVHAGRFREDLWFRLNVFPIPIPPLRERTSDIPALVQHFVDRKAQELKLASTPVLAPGAIDALLGYAWPGNVRELENIVERAMILHRGVPLEFGHLAQHAGEAAARPQEAELQDLPPLDSMVERHIRRALDRSGGKIHGPGGAAELLGLNPNTLRSKMRKLSIPFPRGVRRA